jgi:hypothetical protein
MHGIAAARADENAVAIQADDLSESKRVCAQVQLKYPNLTNIAPGPKFLYMPLSYFNIPYLSCGPPILFQRKNIATSVSETIHVSF